MYTLREIRTIHTRCAIMYVCVLRACVCACMRNALMRNCVALFVKFISYIAVLRVYLSAEFKCVCIGIYVFFLFSGSLIPAMDSRAFLGNSLRAMCLSIVRSGGCLYVSLRLS